MNRSSGGRHRPRAERAAVWCAVPVALCVACAGVAQAAPAQPGTGGGSQPGTGGGSQPGTSAPAPEQTREYLPGYTPSPNVQNSQWRQYSDWESGNQQAQYETPQYAQWTPPQTDYDAAPSYQQAYVEEPAQAAPSVVEPAPAAPPMVERKVIVPVEAPEGYIFTGAGLLKQPGWMPDEDRDRITNTIAAIQADAGNALTDAGVNAPQADRITGGAIGGGLLGAGIVGTAMGGTAAVIGAGIGAGAGAGIGAAVTAPTGGWGVGPGAAIGAGVGAGVLGVPFFVLGAGLGGAGGAVAGATVFGGQDATVQEPVPVPAPESVPEQLWTPPPVVDTAAVSAQTVAVVEQVETVPGGSAVVEQARDFVAAAPVYVEQATPRVDASAALVRDAALAQPGGDQVVATVESAGTNAAAAAAPVIEQAAAFAGAVVHGLNA